jgi:DNA-binding response OmpR family regulator
MSTTISVLVVDDNPEIRQFLQDYLSEHGYQVLAAHDGPAARTLLAEQVPAVVLLDVGLPGEDGLTLARWLRLRHRPELPVILYTGHREALSESQVQAAGVRALMRKPVEVAELHALLGTLLPAAISTG